MRFVVGFVALASSFLLSASHCPHAPKPEACTLECPLGQKTDLDGNSYCECKVDDSCTPTRVAVPYADPNTGVCVPFASTCDVPAGFSPCACTPEECGPLPPPAQCAEGTVAEAVMCGRGDDGVCQFNTPFCVDLTENCNTVECPEGFGCCNFSCSRCAPAGAVCTQEACEDASVGEK